MLNRYLFGCGCYQLWLSHQSCRSSRKKHVHQSRSESRVMQPRARAQEPLSVKLRVECCTTPVGWVLLKRNMATNEKENCGRGGTCVDKRQMIKERGQL